MKSTGAPVVSWCSHWKNVCWQSVPGMPHTTGPVGTPAGVPSRVATLPSDSIRSEEHTSELQSLMRTSYAVYCLKKHSTNTFHISQLIHTNQINTNNTTHYH